LFIVHKQGRRPSLSNYEYFIQSFLQSQFTSNVKEQETSDDTFPVYPTLFLDTPMEAKHGNTDKNDESIDDYNHFFGCTSVPIETDGEFEDYFTCKKQIPFFLFSFLKITQSFSLLKCTYE
jgi:hypothetical protein